MAYAQWNPQANYLAGDSVYDSVTAYQAVVDNTAQQPSLNTPAVWAVIPSGGGGVPSVNGETGPIILQGATDEITVTTVAPNTIEFALENTGVVAGTYTFATVEVDADGRVLNASSGSPSGGVPSINSQTGAITLTASGIASISNPSPDTLSVDVPLPTLVQSLNTLSGTLVLTGSGAASISSPTSGTLSVDVPVPVSSLNTLTGAVTLAGSGGLSVSASSGTITLTQGAAQINKQAWVVSSPAGTIPAGSGGIKFFSQTFTPSFDGKVCMTASCYITPQNASPFITSLEVYAGHPTPIFLTSTDVRTENIQNYQVPLSISWSQQVTAGNAETIELHLYYNGGSGTDIAYSQISGFAFLTTD